MRFLACWLQGLGDASELQEHAGVDELPEERRGGAPAGRVQNDRGIGALD